MQPVDLVSLPFSLTTAHKSESGEHPFPAIYARRSFPGHCIICDLIFSGSSSEVVTPPVKCLLLSMTTQYCIAFDATSACQYLQRLVNCY